MQQLKRKKYFALFGILVLVMMIAGIFVLSKYDRFKGLISLKDAKKIRTGMTKKQVK